MILFKIKIRLVNIFTFNPPTHPLTHSGILKIYIYFIIANLLQPFTPVTASSNFLD